MMKKNLAVFGLVFSATLFASGTQSAEQLFDAKCSACHVKTRPADRSSLIAPPAMGVMRHVKEHYGTKDAAVAFIADYVLNPQRSKAVCMAKSIDRFGLMPSQKGAVTEAEARIIAGWMYDNFPPKSMMGKSCRGSKGQGMQKGRGMQKGKGMQKGMQAKAGRNGPGSKGKKGKKASPFLITKGLPHLTGMLMQHWDDPALGLTPEQKEKLLLVRKETLQGVKRIKPQVMRLEKEIRMLVRDGAGNAKVDPMIDELAGLKAEASKIHVKCLHDTRAVLTPKQMQYLMQARQQRKAQ
jgi:Spy/CpxP family protein refolding chaperone